ncbi:hypothetical protein BHM03_00045700, partial [Ensete ventricosum]
MYSAQRLGWLSSSFSSTLATKLDSAQGKVRRLVKDETVQSGRYCWCIVEIVLVGDRGPRSRQWCTNPSEMKALVVSIWGLCMIGAAGELDCFSAHIRLREPGKSEDKAEWSEGARKRRRVQWGSATQKAKRRLERRWTRRSTTVPQRRIYRSRRKGCRCKSTDSRAMGLAAPWYRRGGTSVESSIP